MATQKVVNGMRAYLIDTKDSIANDDGQNDGCRFVVAQSERDDTGDNQHDHQQIRELLQ